MIEDPTAPVSEEPSEGSKKRLRWIELCLVLFVAFGGSVALSIVAVTTQAKLYPGGNVSGVSFFGVLQEVSAMAVFLYVLCRQGRNLSDLGFSFKWSDIPISIGLAFAALLGLALFWQVIAVGYALVAGKVPATDQQNIEFVSAGFSLWSLLLILINPFFEELIVRGFLITELQTLVGKTVVAVVASVLLQSIYHLYQGVIPATLYSVMFLIFSLYYVTKRRILPVILAHLYFDFYALIYYSFR